MCMQSLSWLLRQQLCPHTHSGTIDRISRIESSDFANSELFFLQLPHTSLGFILLRLRFGSGSEFDTTVNALFSWAVTTPVCDKSMIAWVWEMHIV